MASSAELRWAQKYNGWARFASNHDAYLLILEPAIREYEATGRVPEWCGVDLLRAWAFVRQREHYNAGGGPMARDWDDVLDALRMHPDATALDLPPLPDDADERAVAELVTDWESLMRAESARHYWARLERFIEAERSRAAVCPERDDVLRALDLTPLEDVRAVIVGQDPYHGPGQAHGLCFSVPPGVTIPPSLRNIFELLQLDLGIAPPITGRSSTGLAKASCCSTRLSPSGRANRGRMSDEAGRGSPMRSSERSRRRSSASSSSCGATRRGGRRT